MASDEHPIVGWQRFPTLVIPVGTWYGPDNLADRLGRARFALSHVKFHTPRSIDMPWDVFWDRTETDLVMVFPQNEGAYLWLMANSP